MRNHSNERKNESAQSLRSSAWSRGVPSGPDHPTLRLVVRFQFNLSDILRPWTAQSHTTEQGSNQTQWHRAVTSQDHTRTPNDGDSSGELRKCCNWGADGGEDTTTDSVLSTFLCVCDVGVHTGYGAMDCHLFQFPPSTDAPNGNHGTRNGKLGTFSQHNVTVNSTHCGHPFSHSSVPCVIQCAVRTEGQMSYASFGSNFLSESLFLSTRVNPSNLLYVK